MNVRKPVCLIVTTGIQILLVGYFLSCFLAGKTRGADEGYSANFGAGVLIALGGVGLYFLGFLLVIASLIRREPFSFWAYASLAIYCFPIVIAILYR
jgi:hypothetical protein